MPYVARSFRMMGAPRNLVPVMLGYLRGEDSGGRALFRGSSGKAEAFSDFDALASYFRGTPGTAGSLPLDPAQILNFGPPMSKAADGAPSALPAPQLRPGQATVVVIDIGIAFWHRRFHTDTGSAFERVLFINADGTHSAVDMGDTQATYQSGGNRAAMDRLAGQHADSIYGSPRLGTGSFGPSDFAHGTAVADAILQDMPDNVWPRMVGIELPKAAVLDRSGSTLRELLVQCVLPLALAQKASGEELNVVLPYAFTGGPHDPVGAEYVQAIEQMLAAADAKLYLPQGNHLQDRLHVKLADIAAGTESEPVTWRLFSFDETRNVLELWWKGADTIALCLTDPIGEAVEMTVRPGGVTFISQGDADIAGCQSLSDGEWQGALVCLEGTQAPWGSTAPPARAGDWTLRVTPDNGDMINVQGWVRRDDPADLSGAFARSQQSEIFDPSYPTRGALGTLLLDDAPGTAAGLSRRGSESFLTSGTATARIAVGASEDTQAGADAIADYSGRGILADNIGRLVQVGTRMEPGRQVLTNGAGDWSHVNGTSMAVGFALNQDLRSQIQP